MSSFYNGLLRRALALLAMTCIVIRNVYLIGAGISCLAVLVVSLPAYGESLFTSGISKNVYSTMPRSLYSTVKAKSIGDFVTVLLAEEVTTSDDLKLDVTDESSTTDSFSTLLNKILPVKLVPTEIDDFGGKNSTGNTAKVSRTTKFNDTITAQVVQVLPNGNLVIQGKKTAINAGENVNILISGIIDSRFIDSQGRVKSSQISNLQFAVTGKGTISGSGRESPVNRLIRRLF